MTMYVITPTRVNKHELCNCLLNRAYHPASNYGPRIYFFPGFLTRPLDETDVYYQKNTCCL